MTNLAAVATGGHRSYFIQKDGTVLAAGPHRTRAETFKVPAVILTREQASGRD